MTEGKSHLSTLCSLFMDGCLVACVHDISHLKESLVAIFLRKSQNLNVQRTEMPLVILVGDFHGAADVVALPPAMELLAQK